MLKLVFVKNHATISELNDTELPSFTLLTGRNGVGKSHLLEAIKAGDIAANNIPAADIGLINLRAFSIEAGGAQQYMNVLNAISSINSVLQNTVKPRVTSQPGVSLDANEKAVIYTKATTANKSPLTLVDSDFNAEEAALSGKYTAFLAFVDQVLIQSGVTRSQRRFIDHTAELTTKLYDDIGLDDMQNTLWVDDYNGGVLPSQLSFTIMHYAKIWRRNLTNTLLNLHQGHTHVVLSEKGFEERHGPRPWKFINDNLESFGGFKYRLDFDEQTFDPEAQSLVLQFRNVEDMEAEPVPIERLSSGEKTLIALIISLYSASADSGFPKLLLLDEIDGSLHPSMTSIFLKIIQENIVENLKIPVILVTHSPSTVALAPDSSIHTMTPTGAERIVKTSKGDALDVLTEGFIGITSEHIGVSLKFTLRDAPKDLVFFEGPTDAEYIKAADQRAQTHLSDSYEITYSSGAGSLDAYWKLVTSTDTRSGYTHGKGAMLIYDCDKPRGAESYSRHTRWSLTRVAENPIYDGIENLFSSDLVRRAKGANPSYFFDDSKNVGKIKVNDAYKMELSEWFIANATEDDWRPFVSIIDDIKAKYPVSTP